MPALADLRFSPAHVWARVEDGVAVVGLTDYLQDQLGDIIAIDLPDIGDVVRAQRRMGGVRSDEAATALESPITGEVVDVNNEVLHTPDLANHEPYDGGWLLRVRLEDATELDDLMSEEEYTELTTEV